MPLDTRIALSGNNPLDTQAKLMTLAELSDQQQARGLQMQQTRDNMQRQQQLRGLLGGLAPDTTDDGRVGALRNAGYFDEADKLQTGVLARDKTRAEVGKLGAETGKISQETWDKRRETAIRDIAGFQSPEEARQDLIRNVRSGLLDPAIGEQLHRSIPQDPNAFRQWQVGMLRRIMAAKDAAETLTPKSGVVDGGNRQVFTRTDPLTGQVTEMGSTPKIPEGFVLGPGGRMTADPGFVAGKSQIAAAGATRLNIPINTEKTYAGNVAEGVAKQDLEAIDAAKSAPDKVRTARQIRDIITSGAPITGTLAEQRLAISKALSTAGIIDGNQVAATEGLASSLAAQTLSNIKTAGLGTGAGFTNADRDFLERAASGKIDMTPQALLRLTQLNETSAVRSVERGNKVIARLRGDRTMGGVAAAFELIELPRDDRAPGNPPGTPARPVQPTAPAPTDWRSAGYASPAQAVQDARGAIERGADKAAVIQRLEAAGIMNHGIR